MIAGMYSSKPRRELLRPISILTLFLASSAALLVIPAASQAAEATAGLNPPALTFPSVIVDKSDPQQQFVLTNNGPEEIVVEGVSVNGANPNDFSLENDGCATVTLSSGESCSLYISFTPSASGLREAQLEVLNNGENSPTIAELSGRGLSQELTVSPSPLIFPTTTVGNSSESHVTVANNSEAAVMIHNVNIEGAGSSAFNTNGSDCGASLNPGQSCKISIRFSPGNEGEERAFLHVRSEGNPSEQIVELSGISAPPQLSFEPESYEFGLQSVKEGSAQTTMQLRNTGEGPVQVSLEISGSGSNDFNIGTSDCYGATLAPNETCSIQVHFDPNETGFYVAQVRARANNGATFTAEVSGTGGRAVLSGSPNPADFGEATVGSTGLTRTITMTNSGDLPGGLFITLISGGDAASFQLVEEDCTAARLEPEGSCSAEVRFQPTGPGLRSAKLTFVGGEEGVVQVELNGLGLAPELALSPSGHDFGSQAENSAGPAQIFAITNEGKTSVALNAASITGVNPDQFRLSTDTCTAATLGPGEGCQLGARFAPDSVGAKTATLRLAAGPESLTASLSGTGVPSSPPPPPSNAFSFGKFKANTKQGTATQSVTVPGPGKVVLTGNDVKEAKKTASQQDGVTLSIGSTGKAKSQLNKTGKVKVKVAVSFTPTGGVSKTQKKTVKLVKKR
jgi:Abnormal spindle-like microcephaly-assoc'd, ASPM-SPD-2-Hydin